MIWMDGRPHPPAWAPHTLCGFSTGKFVGNALVVETTPHQAGLAAAERHSGERSGDAAGIFRAPRRPPYQHHRHHRSGVPGLNRRFAATIISARWWITDAWLYACDDGEQISGRAPDKVPNYLFGQQPFAKEFSQKSQASADIGRWAERKRFIPSSWRS